MIGAILTKRAVRHGYATVNRQDPDAVAALFHEDAVLEFPGETVKSGRFEGREAIREWFANWFEMMPVTRFTLRHISVEDIFAITNSNVVHVEWDLEEADRDGHRYRLTGVTAFAIERGMARAAKDYIFDQPVLARILPPKAPATRDDAGDRPASRTRAADGRGARP
jgi:ketosteroid isomerase-like protein